MRDEARLRRTESTGELADAITLAREFGDWATERIRIELGVEIPAEANHPTGVLDEVLESGGRVLGCETIYLESAPLMQQAHTLNRSVGFEPSGSYPGRGFEDAGQVNSVFMRLDLE